MKLLMQFYEDWREDPDAPPVGTVVCAIADLADACPRVFVFGRRWNALEIIVVRDGNEVHAYLNRCAHQALPLNLGRSIRTTAERLLLCDHHAAAFRIRDGFCVDGVCHGASLIAIPIAQANGSVLIAEPVDLR